MTGLAGSGLTLQNNGGDDLSVANNGPFEFDTPIPDGRPYEVTVLTHPPGQVCSVTNGAGAVTGDNITTITVSCENMVSYYYENGADWNDYLADDGATGKFDASDTVCSTGACMHGGEMRAYTVAGVTDCANITASDGLGAFDWTCISDGSNDIRLVSSGMAEGVYLSDLIDWNRTPPAWLENTLTVTDGASLNVTSPAAVWWSNPVVENNDGGTLDTESTIYVVTNGPTALYNITADKVGLVVKPGTTLTAVVKYGYQQTIRTTGDSQQHLWIEGTVSAANGRAAIYLNNVDHSVIQNVTVTGATSAVWDNYQNASAGIYMTYYSSSNKFKDIIATGNRYGIYQDRSSSNVFENIDLDGNGTGIYVWNSYNCRYTDIRAYNNSSDGIRLDFGTGNLLTDVVSSNNGGHGFYLEGSNDRVVNSTSSNNGGAGFYLRARDNILIGATAFNNATHGVYIYRSSRNLFLNLTTTNNGADGVFMTDYNYHARPNYNRFINVVSAGNSDDGFEFVDANWGSFFNIAAADNGGYGFKNPKTNSSWNMFDGVVKVGGNATADCTAGANTDCSGLLGTTYTLVSGVDTSGSFVGKAAADAVNTHGSTGTLYHDSITDWTNFQHLLRGWGLEGADHYPDAGNRGQCTTDDTCRIWDWTLAVGDLGDPGPTGNPGDELPVLMNIPDPDGTLPTGNDTFTHTWLYNLADSQADCDFRIPGSVFDGVNRCNNTFLQYAVEIIGDGIGNENGLCESDETCLYTPNIGSYQGHVVNPAGNCTTPF